MSPQTPADYVRAPNHWLLYADIALTARLFANCCKTPSACCLAGFLRSAPPRTHIGMPYLGSARLVFDLLAAPVSPSLRRPLSSLRSLYFSSPSSISTPTHWPPPRRAFSRIPHSRSELFNYTSGRWL